MIVEEIANYVCHRTFVYQLLATLGIYYSITLVRFLIIRKRRYQLYKEYDIPGPEPSMFDGHTRMYYKDRKLFEVAMDMSRKYAPTWSTFQGDWPTLTSTDPDLLRYVFIEANDVFSERTRPFMDIQLVDGILFCQRPRWRFFRKILGPYFNRFTNRGQESVQFVEDSIQLMIKYIDQKMQTSNTEKKLTDVDLYDLIKSNALYIISELAIKLPNNKVQENEPNVVALDKYLTKTDGFFFRLSLIYPAFRDILSWVVENIQINGYMSVVYRALGAHIKTTTASLDHQKKLGKVGPPKEETVLDMLIRLMHNNQLTQRELFGNAEALLFAGYDTTSTTLIYTLWNIAKYQDVQERLKDELMINGSDSKYLEQVLHESMRLYPVVASFTTRCATKSTVFKGLVIPQETLFIYNNYVMHRNPAYWKDPEIFDPERFANGLEKIDPIYFAPFGLGERKCLGAKLAMLQMKIILTELVLRYKLTLISPDELNMVTCGFSLTKPGVKVKIQLEKRVIN